LCDSLDDQQEYTPRVLDFDGSGSVGLTRVTEEL
jgi:hypothetical protein